MIMNKKGFTLIELLAVIAVIALISLIAIPNIVGLTDGIRKDQMLDDAKKLISMAKYQVNKDYAVRNSVSHTFQFSELNVNNDIGQDPDSTTGANYISGTVEYTNTGTARYCIYLVGSKRKICRFPEGANITDSTNCNLCVYEDELYSRANVHDK